MNPRALMRWKRFPDIGCVCCKLQGRYAVPEVHHLLSGGRRRGHAATIPLCPAHHRGLLYDAAVHLASVAAGSKSFHRIFGTDNELLELTDTLLNGSITTGKPS